jgi:branched-chain amino acid transport system ATP-binding protein
MPLLEISDVTAGYGAGPDILTGVSLEVEEGRSYCIIGPNGAGKSTLLKVVAGLLQPRAGSVVFNGTEIGGKRPDIVLSNGVCFVPQDGSLFPEMTVKENLVMGAYLTRDRDAIATRLDEMMDLFPILGERSSQMAQTLSGGEQQQLLLARAMMINPKLMMIDEPSLGLAPQVATQIFEVIKSLTRDHGMTLLLVEQNVRMGLAVSDWSFVLDLGTKRFEGPAGTILDDQRIRDLYLGKLAKAGEGNE